MGTLLDHVFFNVRRNRISGYFSKAPTGSRSEIENKIKIQELISLFFYKFSQFFSFLNTIVYVESSQT